MKNNIRGFIFHIIVAIFVFGISLLINMSVPIRNLVYSNIFFKIIISFLPIRFYYNLAKGMSKRTPKSLDFFYGSLIVLVSIILGLIAFMGLGMKIFSSTIASSIWRLPLDLFLLPQMYILEIFKIKHNIITFTLAILAPGFIYGFSIRKSRQKIAKQKRAKRIKEQRKRQARQSGY